MTTQLESLYVDREREKTHQAQYCFNTDHKKTNKEKQKNLEKLVLNAWSAFLSS